MSRCPWPGNDPLPISYHDIEWGVPLHDDRLLFEFLVLDGFQAGLSWKSVLCKRDAFRRRNTWGQTLNLEIPVFIMPFKIQGLTPPKLFVFYLRYLIRTSVGFTFELERGGGTRSFSQASALRPPPIYFCTSL
jgi:hypothetical protein